jgi:O-acetyl-ADP-ribose deacetylase (regulator of RNase III)
MPLSIQQGDLLDRDLTGTVIINGCNAKGVMGAGFAFQIRTKFPEAFDFYRREFLRRQLKLGTVLYTHDFKYNCTIANCVTQEYYGRDPTVTYADYDAVASCTQNVATQVKHLGRTKIYLPLVGGGLGGCVEGRLIPIYEKSFANVDAVLWLK